MNSCNDGMSLGRAEELSTLLGDAERSAHDGLGRSGAETDYDLWLHGCEFAIEPRAACRYFRRVRLFVDTALSSRLPFEVLHRVGDIDLISVDARLFQSGVQQGSGGPNKWTPLKILFVSGLLADEEHTRVCLAFTKDGFRSALPQLAVAAILCFPSQNFQASGLGH